MSISLAYSLLGAGVVVAQQQSSGPREIVLKRRTVDKVVLNGVRSFSASDIKKVLYTKPNRWYNFLRRRELSRANVNIDVATIKRFYQRRGYLFPRVDAEILRVGNDKATVVFNIDEGRRTYLQSVNVGSGVPEINRKFRGIINSIKTGVPVDNEVIISNGFKLRDLYFDNGYPYAKISSNYSFNDDSTFAAASYTIAESTYTVNNAANVRKLGHTKSNVIKRELVVTPGKTYRRRDVLDSEQRLYSTGLFKYIAVRRDDSTAFIINDTCHVNYTIVYQERKPSFISFGLGLGRQQAVGPVLSTLFQWGNRNMAGTGRKLILGSQPQFLITGPGGTSLSGVHVSDVFKRLLRFRFYRATNEIDYVEPWLFGYRVPTTIRILYEPYTLNTTIPERPYRYDRIASDVTFSHEFNRTTRGRAVVTTEYINILNVPPDQEQFYRKEGDNQIRRLLTFYGEHDTRDNILSPLRGSYSYAQFDFVGGPLGGDFSFVKGQFSWSRYNRIIGQNILASRIWLGALKEIGSHGLSSSNDRFLLGGAYTIRGFTENSLGPKFTAADSVPADKIGTPKGGRYLFLSNFELRRPLFWRFGSTAFFDIGNTYYNWKDIKPISIAFSTGLGAEFFTPVGPIRFEYGVRLKKQFDLAAGVYHLAILYAF